MYYKVGVGGCTMEKVTPFGELCSVPDDVATARYIRTVIAADAMPDPDAGCCFMAVCSKPSISELP